MLLLLLGRRREWTHDERRIAAMERKNKIIVATTGRLLLLNNSSTLASNDGLDQQSSTSQQPRCSCGERKSCVRKRWSLFAVLRLYVLIPTCITVKFTALSSILGKLAERFGGNDHRHKAPTHNCADRRSKPSICW